MKFKAEFLRNELDLPDDAVNDRIIDNGRWNITVEAGNYIRCSKVAGNATAGNYVRGI